MKHLLKYFSKHKVASILAPLFKILEAGFDLCVPLIVADIIDVGIATGDKTYILVRFALLVGMALLGLGCAVVAQYFAAKVAVRAATGLRRDLFAKVGTFGFGELDRIGTSTLITRMTGDVTLVQNGVNLFLRLFLRSPVIVFGAMALAFVINAKIGLVFVAAIAILFIIVFGVMRLTSPGYRRVQENLDRVTGEVRENGSGVRVIRAFGREALQHGEFADSVNALTRSQLAVGRLASLLNPLTYLVVNTVIILVLWMGASLVDGGTLLSGDVIALVNYIGQILVELVKLANLIVVIGKAMASARRIGQILDTDPALTYGEATPDFTADEAVRFEGVSLTYENADDESLTAVTFTARRGQTVGIIGGTGSGKSTLVHLIARFYDATAGEVRLFGTPIRTLSREALLSSVAIVDQKPRLFSGTVRSNLLWGRGDATDEELWAALELAQAADFIRSRPEGLDAPVSAGGNNFSGGQKQRLTIARAILCRAKILILDDSTSALDLATDAALRRALRTLPEDLTVFLVSQRTSSIAYADKILVLDDGALVATGTHEELLSSSDVYREIVESQTEKEGK